MAPGQGVASLDEEQAAAVTAAFEQVAAEDLRTAPQWTYRHESPGHSDHVVCLAAHGMRASLAASGGKDQVVILWDVARGAPLHRLQMGTMPLDCCFGRGAQQGSLYVALDAPDDVPGGTGKFCSLDIESGAELYSLPQSRGHVSCVHGSAAGDTFLLGAADGTIRQYRARDGTPVFSFASGMSDVNLVSLSSDETYVQASGDKDQTFIIDVRRPDRAVHVLQHEGSKNMDGSHVNGVSASWCHRSRTTLVTGSDDAVVRIWDVSLGKPLLTRMEGHASPVSCVAVSPEDELIASGGDEGKVVLYSRAAAGAGSLSVGEEGDLFLRNQAEA